MHIRTLKILFAMLLMSVGCGSDPGGPGDIGGGKKGYDWNLEFGSPVFNDIYCVWIAPDGTRFLGTANAVFTFDGTSKWKLFRLDGFGSVLGLWGTSQTNVFGVGTQGRIVHFDGNVWTAMTSPATSALNDIFGFSGIDIYAVGNYAIVHYDGSDWTDITPAGGVNNLRAIWGSAPDNIYAVGGSGTILFYNGTSWMSQTSGTISFLRAVWGTSATDVYAAGWNGVVLKLNGSMWDDVSPPSGPYFEGIWAASETNYIFAGGRGVFYRYDGADWTTETFDHLSAAWDVSGTSADDIIVTAQSGTVYLYDGMEWSIPGITKAGMTAVWGVAADDVYASNIQGWVFHYDGTEWTPTHLLTDYRFYGGCAPASDNVYVCGGLFNDGRMFRFNGTSWNEVTLPTTAGLRSMFCLGANNVYAVGRDGVLLHYDGTWNQYNSGNGEELTSIQGTSPTNLYVTSTTNIYKFNGTNLTPQTLPFSSNWNSVWAIDDKAWAVGTNGNYVYFDGTEWTAPGNFSSQIQVFSIYGFAADDIYTGAYDGEIFHFNGTTWTKMLTPVTAQIYGFWGPDASSVIAVGGNGNNMVLRKR